jgi:hypothetical protein
MHCKVDLRQQQLMRHWLLQHQVGRRRLRQPLRLLVC